MPGLMELKNRVAGHTKFVDLGKYLLKGMDVREYHFYRKMSKCSKEFKSIFPKFYGVRRLVDPENSIFEEVDMDEFDIIAEECRKAKRNEMKDYFICIENFSYHMKYPCSMDVKLGCHWSYAGVSETRGKKYDDRWEKTTSASVGLRYCGHIGFSTVINSDIKQIPYTTITEIPDSSPKVYRVYQNKDAGWKMKIDNLEDTICQFFCYPELKFRPELVKKAIEKIEKMIKPLEEQKVFTFRSTSLLMTYSALEKSDIKVALIDFSHEYEVTPEMIDEKEGIVPGDADIVQSLKNLVGYLKHRLREEEKE